MVVALAAACAPSGAGVEQAAPVDLFERVARVEADVDPTPASSPPPQSASVASPQSTAGPTPPNRSPLADWIVPGPPAPTGFTSMGEAGGPVPVGLRITSIGVDGAAVRSVGVEPDGDMEIPEASEVGWYEFGPRPGEEGSAVLAAHVAAAGRDGVFRHLADLEPGDEVEVTLGDGSAVRFSVLGVAQYAKDGLPVDEIFATDGIPRLTLVTCGGAFDPTARSYRDNVVAVAIPVSS